MNFLIMGCQQDGRVTLSYQVVVYGASVLRTRQNQFPLERSHVPSRRSSCFCAGVSSLYVGPFAVCFQYGVVLISFVKGSPYQSKNRMCTMSYGFSAYGQISQ